MISLRELPEFNSFDQLKEYFFSKGKLNTKSIARNTKIGLFDGPNNSRVLIIKYHQTPIVAWYKDKIVLNHGGWKTTTTKSRMNTFLPQGYKIYQNNFEWFITVPDQCDIPFFHQILEIPYVS